MDVSVVIPTRDRPELLALTLRSVLWQEGVELEVLVVDDGDGARHRRRWSTSLGTARVRAAAQHGPTRRERRPQQRHRRGKGQLDRVPGRRRSVGAGKLSAQLRLRRKPAPAGYTPAT